MLRGTLGAAETLFPFWGRRVAGGGGPGLGRVKAAGAPGASAVGEVRAEGRRQEEWESSEGLRGGAQGS